jgi:photosystem II stability/assembly factor-like uncharacterized protein
VKHRTSIGAAAAVASLAGAVVLARVGAHPPTEQKQRARRGEEHEAKRAHQTIRGVAATARSRIAAQEKLRWPHLIPGSGHRLEDAPLGGEVWVNLGPTDAGFEWNGSTLATVNSGRGAAVAPDPRDPDVVYFATSGGGVWKTWDFVSSETYTHWHPISDGLAELAIGGMDISQLHPDTLIISTGDAYDLPGRSIFVTKDGGATWSDPLLLEGTYPMAAGGLRVRPNSTRDLKIDPKDDQNVMVATDVGLFRSTDGGATFSLIDLPNAGGSVPEAIWSIVYAGGAAGSTVWLATGVTACDGQSLPPIADYGVLPGGTSYMMNDNGALCSLGNLGDVWRSTDSGQTWTSIRAQGGLPAPPFGDFGRAQLTPSNTSDPDHTVVFAMLSAADENNPATVGFFRSSDGGQHWADVTGTLSNPTLTDNMGNGDCVDMNIAQFQSWYNVAIAVDTDDPNKVIAGGSLCGIRTVNGMTSAPTWENVSNWLPIGSNGSTAVGTLPFLHADWHNALVTNIAGVHRVWVMSDGGLFTSTNVFDRNVRPNDVVWTSHNRTLATHLMWGMGTGDPMTGNPFTMILALQDNGTRMRHSYDAPTTFDEVTGGDGFEAAVSYGPVTGEVLWADEGGSRNYCLTNTGNCDIGGNWTNLDPTLTDMNDYFLNDHITPIQTSTSGGEFLTASLFYVFKSTFFNINNPSWKAIGTFNGNYNVRKTAASQNVPGLYGAVLTGGHFAVTADGGAQWSISTGGMGVGTATLAEGASMSFPPNVGMGKNPGDEYVGVSSAWTIRTNVLVPDQIGHIFITHDRGATFQPIHGNGTGMDLPNVPIHVVRHAVSDPTGNTIYVATDLGLYRTTDGGQTWVRFGAGLPLVQVENLYVSPNSSLIRVGTYGRGAWEIYPINTAPKGVDGDGDFDQNGRIDWADLAALASRLGTDPSTTAWPTYAPVDDLTGGTGPVPVNAIDEADLARLLQVFGDHP